MKKILFFFMLLGLIVSACKKELGRVVNQEDKPQAVIIVTDVPDIDSASVGNGDDGNVSGDSTVTGDENNQNDGSDEGADLSDPEENEHSVYSFMGVSGTYFGCSSTFKAPKNESLQIIFGTSMTTNLTYTQKEFETLIHPGERTYGSLGAYTSYPERVSNRVEIAYTDKQGRRWSSTSITEKKSHDRIETTVKVEQSKSSFYLDDAHKIEIAAETEGYRLKGRFECTLYEVNGKAKKKLKGDFTGIVAPK